MSRVGVDVGGTFTDLVAVDAATGAARFAALGARVARMCFIRTAASVGRCRARFPVRT